MGTLVFIPPQCPAGYISSGGSYAHNQGLDLYASFKSGEGWGYFVYNPILRLLSLQPGVVCMTLTR